jgi:hypothetical protein
MKWRNRIIYHVAKVKNIPRIQFDTERRAVDINHDNFPALFFEGSVESGKVRAVQTVPAAGFDPLIFGASPFWPLRIHQASI